MGAELVAFFVLTAVALGAAALAIVGASRPGRHALAIRALTVGALCVAAVEASMLHALVTGVAAVIAIAVVGAAALRSVAGAELETDGGGWTRWISPLLAALLIVYVLIGTIARQFVWFGRPLPAGAEFGSPAAVGVSLAQEGAALVIAAPLLVLGAILAALVALDARTRSAS
ncbi:MAG: hypothetical protein H6713_16730 [Myxococcales bacterium]|nr:hypothetical protein [Myxococcales bacterium]